MEVWEKEKGTWSNRHWSVPTAFSFSFRKYCEEKEYILFTLSIKILSLFAHANIASTAYPSSVFLSSYTRDMILNQSAQVFSLGYFLNHSVMQDKQLTQRNLFQYPDRDRLCFISF